MNSLSLLILLFQNMIGIGKKHVFAANEWVPQKEYATEKF